MRMQLSLICSLAVAIGVWAGAADAGEPVRLDAAALDQVTAGAGGFAYFIGSGTASYSGAGRSTIEGQGTANYEETVTYPASGGVKVKRTASGTYKGSSKAQVTGGGTAAASLAAGSGVVLF